jgi:putative SOS response-associated peptidase YedK
LAVYNEKVSGNAKGGSIMCGRFTQKSERKIITLEFYVRDFLSDVLASYNVAPGQDAGVIVKDGVYRYARYRWGLVPFWAKDPKIGYRMINARAETVTEKPSFKNAFAKRRCLIPADGFYEWKKEEKHKTPYYIFLSSNRPMSLAGLYEIWRPKDRAEAEETPPLHTFTIITTAPNEKMRELHDRMPVIIPPDGRETWLEPDAEIERLKDMLLPAPSSEIDFHEVSTVVNSPKNNSPECIAPVA